MTASHSLRLRDVTEADLPTLFEFQRDPDANHMAAFTAADPEDRAAFDAHWARLLSNEAVINKVIEVDSEIIGSVACFEMFNEQNVGYSIGKAYWGRGYATEALKLFLAMIPMRPLYGRVVSDNVRSRRVLEKCGFVVVAQERGYANARKQEVDELVLRLD